MFQSACSKVTFYFLTAILSLEPNSKIYRFLVIFLCFSGKERTLFFSRFWNSKVWDNRLHRYQAYICCIILLISPKVLDY
jgi:hypothetical protein